MVDPLPNEEEREEIDPNNYKNFMVDPLPNEKEREEIVPNNYNNTMVDPLPNEEEREEIDDYGVKKRKKAARENKKKSKLYGKTYKKLKSDGSIQKVDEKNIKENPCFGKKCSNECNTISEEERLLIFNRYWKDFDHTRKRDYLLCCMEKIDIKRKYVAHSSNRLIYTDIIFL